MKRLFPLILVTLLPLAAKAYDAKVNGICYNFTGSEAAVTYESYQSPGYSGVVVVPEAVIYNGKTYLVTSIGDYAFYGCTGLTSVITLFGDSLVYNENLIVNGDFYEWYGKGNTPKGSSAYKGSAGVLCKAIKMLREWAENNK